MDFEVEFDTLPECSWHNIEEAHATPVMIKHRNVYANARAEYLFVEFQYRKLKQEMEERHLKKTKNIPPPMFITTHKTKVGNITLILETINPEYLKWEKV